MDYAALRKKMVEEQLMPRGINDQRLLKAFYKVERHKFIPENLRGDAYADSPVPIAEGQTISQPYIVALMTKSLGLKGKEKVLEIGTGSGYQTAILAELAAEVYSIERYESLMKKAQILINELGYKNIKLKSGDGSLGWIEESSFDRIIITAASRLIPPPLIEQLKEGAKLILPLGENYSQLLTLFEKREGKLSSTQLCGCVFVPLVGKYGYQDRNA